MKKTHFILLILLLPTTGMAQPYESIFGQNSTEWYIASNDIGAEKLWGTDTAYVSGTYEYLGYTWYEVQYPRHFDSDYYREVPDSGKIYGRYLLADYLPNEYLIFDMSLNKGDIFRLGHIDGYVLDIIADSIYYIDGRKIIGFDLFVGFDSLQHKLEFIEGVGPSSSLKEMMMYEGFHFNTTLCLYKDGISTYNSGLLNGRCTLEWVGIEQPEAESLNIYPNPVNNFLNIDNPFGKTINIQITDIYGKELYYINKSATIIDVSFLTPGLYIIKTNQNYLTKFIKL